MVRVPVGHHRRVSDMDTYPSDAIRYAKEAGILAGVESFLKGLPDTVRDALSAGEIADIVLNMISDLRKKNYGEMVQ